MVTLATKVAFLGRPGSYPESPSTVEAIETRLSWVFLTPAHAWKLKKPVRYDHLDFSELDARRRDCEAECALNRPLAPGVYLSVVPLTCEEDDRLAIDGVGDVVDYLVCMRRLPRLECLEERIRSDSATPEAVERAAETLASFYRELPVIGPVDPDAIATVMESEAGELATLPVGPGAGVEDLRDRLRSTLKRIRATLATRARREVHGDLRPQHVYLGDPPVFLDRLTFHRELRLMDPLEELAFLALDCERLGAAWVGRYFLDVHARITGDDWEPELLAFYRARRALLWALLSARHLVRGGHQHWHRRTLAYLRLGRESLATVNEGFSPS
ncbi:MAG: hypothetical protein U5K33_03250 [Halofilum sp. (in: g-proteobacteria)]|nr:hypothetical protein [Halofilum sp. (in: g-proteobacteria)]